MLLGPNGRPMSTQDFKKADPPKLGPAFGQWAGRDVMMNQMPGGAVLQFDLSKLTLEDFRAMRDHPTINSSLAVLTFMMHQLDWRIECDDQKIANMIEENLREVWTRLIRGMAQAYWAGYSPMAIEYENNLQLKQIDLSKFKDLIPEECSVNWKKVDGYAPPGELPPKFNLFDGIKQYGVRHPIPPENSLWYPVLMENGDYYGRKLLRPAFAAWYFSILMHLFSNRYFERFGEPLPVGRAPFDDQIDIGGGKSVSGKEAMETILMNLRNRGVVTLPSDRDPITKDYDYDISYLESQMRGADFERYMARLDEEMSLALFTPILLFQTGDSGSYNLGVQQMQMYMWMLNALAGDLKEYIDKYVVARVKDYNFGPNAPKAKWVYRKMGKENVETMRAIISALLSGNQATVDLDQLGEIIGLTVKEVRQLTDPNGDPNGNVGDTPPGTKPKDKREVRDKPKSSGPKGTGQPRATGKQISARIAAQVNKAWQQEKFGPEFEPSMGYHRRFEDALLADGYDSEQAKKMSESFYTRVNNWVRDAVDLGKEQYNKPEDFMQMFDTVLEVEIDQLVGSE